MCVRVVCCGTTCQVLDADGSGFIDREELVKALSKYGDLSDLDSVLSQVRAPGWDGTTFQ